MTIFWFRRDLRIKDNAGLYEALKNGKNVQPIFIFDKSILSKLSNEEDARITFIYETIERLKNELQTYGSDLKVFFDYPANVFSKLINDNITAVYANRDYEPDAIKRDREIFDLLKSKNIPFIAKKDQVIFERNEIVKSDGNPYTVYTPYSKKWLEKLNDFNQKSYPTEKYLSNLNRTNQEDMISIKSIGFVKSSIPFPNFIPDLSIILNYDKTRDLPSIKGTTRLSLHLRFGTVSIRELVRYGIKHNRKWLNELIWRDFYQMIIYHFPYSAKDSFKRKYDLIEWENNEDKFDAWCQGKTGYPIVDAGMRELNQTGFMHNRVRMIVASFLTKHLLIDWRWGERYFAEKLLDYDLASNVGGWQWAAGSGCDAAPYFRVFNPYLQTDKFDPNHNYIKRWVPEYKSTIYPSPIVDHKIARLRAIETYKTALA